MLDWLPWPRAADASRLKIPRRPAREAARLRIPFPRRFSTIPRLRGRVALARAILIGYARNP